MESVLYDIALSLTNGVGSKGAANLIEEFKQADAIFSCSKIDLVSRGVKPAIAASISSGVSVDRARSVIELCKTKGVKVLVRGSCDYPTLLNECIDAPHVLYQYGDIDLNNYKLVSIVGTRKASSEGLEVASTIVRELAEDYHNIVIVSGLAFGIDKQAHLWALKCGVPTVAVLPGWVLDIAPSTHTELARNIIRQGGAIVSDMPPGTTIARNSFLSRNRIVAGISSATIVVESPNRSGSISTATMASSYSRAVFAVPGRSSDTNAYGTNLLIKTSRAILYQDSSDLATELGWTRRSVPQVEKEVIDKLLPYIRRVFESLPESEPLTLEEISEVSDESLSEVISALIKLEILGYVKSIPGGLYIRSRF